MNLLRQAVGNIEAFLSVSVIQRAFFVKLRAIIFDLLSSATWHYVHVPQQHAQPVGPRRVNRSTRGDARVAEGRGARPRARGHGGSRILWVARGALASAQRTDKIDARGGARRGVSLCT